MVTLTELEGNVVSIRATSSSGEHARVTVGYEAASIGTVEFNASAAIARNLYIGQHVKLLVQVRDGDAR